jgi:hypothetical protein
MTNGTVVEVTEVLVEPPLVDGAPARVRRLAICSTFEQAAICAQQRMTERSSEGGGILYYVLDMIMLDTARQRAPTAVFGRERIRGMIPGDIEKPWGGRAPEDCKYKLGDLVGFVTDVYRVGVILGLPPTPEEARCRSHVTLGDDLYLVGLIDRDDPFSPDCFDHEHIRQPLLFDAPPDVPEELREALRHRCLGTEGFPPWTEEATLSKRDPDKVIARVLARFHHDDIPPEKTGGTRATVVLDVSVCFLANALKDANFQILALNSAVDPDARRDLFAHRIVVTKRTAEYLDDAPVLDYGVIGLDALPGLDGSDRYNENETAQMISKAVAEFGLAFERAAYVLMLHPSGKHVFQRIG